MTLHDLFADGEVLGALVTGLLIVGPMLLVVAWEKWRGKGTPPPRTRGKARGA